MGELKTDNEIVGIAKVLLVGFDERIAQGSHAGFVRLVQDDLVGICASFGNYSHGFPAPDEFSATFAEALPASDHRLGHAPRGGAVPAFHRMNGPAIANGAIIPLEW